MHKNSRKVIFLLSVKKKRFVENVENLKKENNMCKRKDKML